jgi:NAD(P)-dependent dehydrogenase (short-subunit alcohol dehydrogenase family)
MYNATNTLKAETQLFAPALGLEPPRGRLAGRKILVVGAGQRPSNDPDVYGNGRAMSVLFAREGAAVACADMVLASAEETVDIIRGNGGKAFAIESDVSAEASIAAMIRTSAQRLGGLDGVVINVGIGNGRSLADETEQSWDAVMDVNLRGHMLTAKHALSALAPGSSIVFISSVASRSPMSRQPAYEASKAALVALCRAVALDGQPRGIRANVISPGLMDTPMGRDASAKRPNRATRPLPFGRQGTGWEVAYPALFLLSAESSYVNSQDLTVDGGLTSSVVLMQA